MSDPVLRLGLPIWGCDEWRGSLYTDSAKSRDYLAQYAEVFQAVEGNSTFYSLPAPASVERWREATPESFRFCFKLPRSVTHERSLRGAAARAETELLLERLAPLGPRQGPYLVQLPPAFGPDRLLDLERFLADWPAERPVGVEVRHPAFYALDGESESEDPGRVLDQVLARHGAARVVMHTGAMRAGDLEHPDIVNARHEKPDLPIDPQRVADSPVDVVVRFVGHPEPPVNEPFLDQWAEIVGRWIERGRSPIVFIHTPNNAHAPALAAAFHRRLAERRQLAPLPPWPGSHPTVGEQLSLL